MLSIETPIVGARVGGEGFRREESVREVQDYMLGNLSLFALPGQPLIDPEKLRGVHGWYAYVKELYRALEAGNVAIAYFGLNMLVEGFPNTNDGRLHGPVALGFERNTDVIHVAERNADIVTRWRHTEWPFPTLMQYAISKHYYEFVATMIGAGVSPFYGGADVVLAQEAFRFWEQARNRRVGNRPVMDDAMVNFFTSPLRQLFLDDAFTQFAAEGAPEDSVEHADKRRIFDLVVSKIFVPGDFYLAPEHWNVSLDTIVTSVDSILREYIDADARLFWLYIDRWDIMPSWRRLLAEHALKRARLAFALMIREPMAHNSESCYQEVVYMMQNLADGVSLHRLDSQGKNVLQVCIERDDYLAVQLLLSRTYHESYYMDTDRTPGSEPTLLIGSADDGDIEDQENRPPLVRPQDRPDWPFAPPIITMWHRYNLAMSMDLIHPRRDYHQRMTRQMLCLLLMYASAIGHRKMVRSVVSEWNNSEGFALLEMSLEAGAIQHDCAEIANIDHAGIMHVFARCCKEHSGEKLGKLVGSGLLQQTFPDSQGLHPLHRAVFSKNRETTDPLVRLDYSQLEVVSVEAAGMVQRTPQQIASDLHWRHGMTVLERARTTVLELRLDPLYDAIYRNDSVLLAERIAQCWDMFRLRGILPDALFRRVRAERGTLAPLTEFELVQAILPDFRAAMQSNRIGLLTTFLQGFPQVVHVSPLPLTRAVRLHSAVSVFVFLTRTEGAFDGQFTRDFYATLAGPSILRRSSRQESPDNEDDHPLTLAVKSRDATIVIIMCRYMQSRGIPVDAGRNRAGGSALHAAVEARDLTMIHLLTYHRHPTNVADANGRTPIQLALQQSLDRRDEDDIYAAFYLMQSGELEAPDSSEMWQDHAMLRLGGRLPRPFAPPTERNRQRDEQNLARTRALHQPPLPDPEQALNDMFGALPPTPAQLAEMEQNDQLQAVRDEMDRVQRDFEAHMERIQREFEERQEDLEVQLAMAEQAEARAQQERADARPAILAARDALIQRSLDEGTMPEALP